MSLDVVIMAHPARAHLVADLQARLDAPSSVVWDRAQNRWDTGRRAILAHSPDATRVLVLQDDAIPAPDLIAATRRAIEVIPENPISLYFGHETNAAHARTRRIAQQVKRPSLIVFEGPWWGVAVVFPTVLIPQMLDHADRYTGTEAYDKKLSHALIRMGVYCYYILPSLVDHRTDGPSMIHDRDQADRHASHFHPGSALDIEWESLPVVDLRRHRGRVPPVTRKRQVLPRR